MDKAVKAGDDFVAYTSGTYLKNLEIPADRSNYGMFTKLRDLSQDRTRQIIEDAAKVAAAPGSNAQKVGDFYASFMDEAAIEAKGLAPIRPQLDAIAALADKAALARMLGQANREGQEGPINVQILQDLKTPDVIAVYAGQGGLGLPDRDYYLDDSNPRFIEARTKYKAYIAELLTLAGHDNVPARAAAIYDLEVKIARMHWTQVESRQVDKLYNPVATAAIAGTYPGFDWGQFLGATGVAGQAQLVIFQPSAVKGAAALIASEPLAVWKDYLAFHTLRSAASLLPKAFVDAKFGMDGKLSDWWTKEDETRFKALTDKVVAQYGAYEPLPGKKINGELTLGENMADLAGVNIAYDAWKRSLGGKPAPVIGGWTGDQRFYLGFSQVWRQKYREPLLNQLLTVDPHSPGHFRAYVVRNLDTWYAAFGVQPGEKYYLAPEQRIKVW